MSKSFLILALLAAAVTSYAQKPELIIPAGHSGGIEQIRFTPDGRYLVTAASFDLKIWEVSTGRLIKTHTDCRGALPYEGKVYMNTHDDIVEIVTGKIVFKAMFEDREQSLLALNRDGSKAILRKTPDNVETVSLIDMTTGRTLHVLYNGKHDFDEYTFTPDGKYVARTGDKMFELIDVQTGKVTSTMNIPYNNEIAFNARNSSILAVGMDYYSVVDISPSMELARITVTREYGNAVELSPDAREIMIADKNTASIFDRTSGVRRVVLETESKIIAAAFSADGKNLAFGEKNGTVKIVDGVSGKTLQTLGGDSYSGFSTYDQDKKFLITDMREEIKVWEYKTGRLLRRLATKDETGSARISGNGTRIFRTYVMSSFTVDIWESSSGKLLNTIKTNLMGDDFFEAAISYDGSVLATSKGYETEIWDLSNNKLLRTMAGNASAFTKNGRYLMLSHPSAIQIIDVASGREISRVPFAVDKYSFTSMFLNNDKIVKLELFQPDSVIMWRVDSGKILYKSSGMTAGFDERYIVMKKDDKSPSAYFDFNTEKLAAPDAAALKKFELRKDEIANLIPVGETDWVVMSTGGLFDASAGAMSKLYFAEGWNIVDFGQLKERYYEPGLWMKYVNGEPLRSVASLQTIESPPSVLIKGIDKDGYLNVELTNAGGGIGEVQVFINGKEVAADARPAGSDKNAQKLAVRVFIANSKNLIPGKENFVGVKAWNGGKWIVSKGTSTTYTPDGNATAPNIYILSVGISDYTGTAIDLKYAAKDAKDFNKALQLGATRLFGTQKTYQYNLISGGAPDAQPTKVNIAKTFEKIASTAKPTDVFVVYLSGHGINYGGQDADWYYLTQEAFASTAEAYNDPGIRSQSTLSSTELVEMFKKVPALKQVLVVDACASGKVVDNLIGQRDIASGTLRALDRMKDRTGMHIITGCAADAVSYEATRFGQGLLTYSLLEGIRGAALRNDQYIDVSQLFQYAQDRVPTLAAGIGGIQSPRVFSPQGSQSFDLGQLSENDKKEIPIASIKPVYIRSTFQDENDLEDVLGLGKTLNESLNNISNQGIDAPLVYIDVADYPEGCKLVGRYSQAAGAITLKLRKGCDGADQNYSITAKDAGELARKIIEVL